MNRKKFSLALVSLASIGVLAGGATTIASAAAGSNSTGTSSSSTSARPAAPHSHKAVTGDSLAKVKAAATKKVSGLTITKVEADPDGTYDVMGTVNGKSVTYDVSKDLGTITERTGGPGGRGGPDGKHGPGHTPQQHKSATATQTAQVKAAVKAKDASVTVTEVRADPDGSYDAMGTKSGSMS